MDKKQRNDARNEVKVLSSLKHPYVVCYRDSFFEEANGLCIIMDYAEGGDLAARIRKARDTGVGFSESQIVRWFSQAALALKYVHEKHILHRDLKTQNLFLTRANRLRLGDFGISKVLDSTLAFAETTIGTPYYLSPEICEEKPYNWASDIWALGCILYELCCLKVPFDATNIKSLVDKITKGPTPELPEHYSAGLRDLLRDCLSRDWMKRPTAAEIVGRGIVQAEIRQMLVEEGDPLSAPDDSPRVWGRPCAKASPLKQQRLPMVPKRNLSPVGQQQHPRRYSPASQRPRGVPSSPVPKYVDPVLANKGSPSRPQRGEFQPRSPVLDDRRLPAQCPDDSPERHPRPSGVISHCSPQPRGGVGPLSPPRSDVGKRRRVGASASPRQARPPLARGIPNNAARPRDSQALGRYPCVVEGVLVPPAPDRRAAHLNRPCPARPPADFSPPHKGHCRLPPAWARPVLDGRRPPHGVSRSVEVENRGPNINPIHRGASPMSAGGILASPMRMGALARRKLESPSSRGGDDSPRSCCEVLPGVVVVLVWWMAAAQTSDDFRDVEYPIVRAKKQPRVHRILAFGYPVTVNGEVPTSYRFQYAPDPEEAPEELHMGVIPAGYEASIRVNREGEDAVTVEPGGETSEIFFCIREGQHGPDFRVCFQDLDSVLLDWTDDVDTLWIEVMAVLEDTQALGEASLEFLDCDPLFLFGVADPTTQKAVERTSGNAVPMLRCAGSIPTTHEWFGYLQADPQIDEEFTWVVDSFANQELPHPWTSVIGVGSIICYVNDETSESTWKHPFYDYFAQLLDHCRHVTKEEHIKLRISRMLWSYEAECNSNILTQEPLISPRYVREIAEVLKVDVITEPYMVRTMKVFLKAFSLQYRLESELDTQEVKYCLEIIDNERNRFAISQEILEQEDPSLAIGPNEA
ncbi:hypothetical protein FOZ62_026390, partial [Perkinsus olseni]